MGEERRLLLLESLPCSSAPYCRITEYDMKWLEMFIIIFTSFDANYVLKKYTLIVCQLVFTYFTTAVKIITLIDFFQLWKNADYCHFSMPKTNLKHTQIILVFERKKI